MNENCCSVDWGRAQPRSQAFFPFLLGTCDPGGGAFPLFLRPHRGAFGSLSVPTPGEFAIQEKKNANALGLARGGGHGRSWN